MSPVIKEKRHWQMQRIERLQREEHAEEISCGAGGGKRERDEGAQRDGRTLLACV